MKREAFEAMVNAALEAMLTDVAEMPVRQRKQGIGGIRYGQAEQIVGRAVSELTQLRHNAKPIVAPSPAFVPPCF